MKKSNKNKRNGIAWLFGGVSVLIVATFVLIIAGAIIKTNGDFQYILVRLSEKFYANPGDFLWGVVGILLTYVSTYMIYATFKEQREQFRQEQQTQFQQRFESTFFNLMINFNSVKEYSLERLKGAKFETFQSLCTAWHRFYNEQMELDANLKSVVSYIEGETIEKTELETAERKLGDMYGRFIKDNGAQIGFFFRYVYNTIHFVENQWAGRDGGEEQIHQYLNFIQAQMTDEELALVFYDAMSDFAIDSNREYTFKVMLDKYNFLQNMPEAVLLDRNHYKFYHKTVFKFLNRDEMRRIKSEA